MLTFLCLCQLLKLVLLTTLCVMNLHSFICIVIWENLVPLQPSSRHCKNGFATCKLKLERQLGRRDLHAASTWSVEILGKGLHKIHNIM